MQGKNIIMVEDDEDDIFLIKTAFAELDMLERVVFFKNGQEALHHIRSCEEQPAVIITDLNMPVMNGMELLAELLQENFFSKSHSKFAILSTSDKSTINHYPADQNRFLFFTKGFSYDKILENLKTITDER